MLNFICCRRAGGSEENYAEVPNEASRAAVLYRRLLAAQSEEELAQSFRQASFAYGMKCLFAWS